MTSRAERVRGCLLGGAIGDALGAPVEFDSGQSILAAHPERLRTFVSGTAGWPAGSITDDTQMTLFTIEGILRGGGTAVAEAYDRWLDTQLLPAPPASASGLAAEPWLYARRAPGNTCLSALSTARADGRIGSPAVNDSKGCGGVMRVAPYGLLDIPPRQSFDGAVEAAAYTHGHPTGQLSSGALAALLNHLTAGTPLDAALDAVLTLLATYPNHQETTAALLAARELAAEVASAAGAGHLAGLKYPAAPEEQVDDEAPIAVEQVGGAAPASAGQDAVGPGLDGAASALVGELAAGRVEELGGGWVGEEALAIGVYAALVVPGPEHVLEGLALAVSHGGDSDSTGAIAGNVLGALYGEGWLPVGLGAGVEGRGVLAGLAEGLLGVQAAPGDGAGEAAGA
ncbi:ADP-ribosylglycohydrolase family protein [Kribbella sandramycini]|uniref:ADP-ribosylglycohydrolase n=1 Tax=Kribbella sandramycini TaxID=60450 RepID=A0A7Y4P4M5_9ACTN|nr:ADP-ribosylglycohydrolase family protein [Kribbella sandramycini]MBB6570134.1 ADP-ribosylglycohydrolase [Kribbella sandramycini]NOL45364.1 ADP-ribosylglycohydrolase family protein [Kribbella sandramycini]